MKFHYCTFLIFAFLFLSGKSIAQLPIMLGIGVTNKFAVKLNLHDDFAVKNNRAYLPGLNLQFNTEVKYDLKAYVYVNYSPLLFRRTVVNLAGRQRDADQSIDLSYTGGSIDQYYDVQNISSFAYMKLSHFEYSAYLTRKLFETRISVGAGFIVNQNMTKYSRYYEYDYYTYAGGSGEHNSQTQVNTYQLTESVRESSPYSEERLSRMNINIPLIVNVNLLEEDKPNYLIVDFMANFGENYFFSIGTTFGFSLHKKNE